MSAILWLRRRILTPAESNVTLSKRGFYERSPDSVALLETVGRVFLSGYGYAVGTGTIAAAREKLETVPRQFRGFAYEGAAMGFAILDALLPRSHKRVPAFLSGPADRHVYMAYVGIGWAYARLPRWRWQAVPLADPLLGWLALDGYGFHQAYFHTDKYVHERHQGRGWPVRMGGFASEYSHRAIDQGIGRALWFVEGTDADRVASRIGTFPEPRRADLWSGAGLAASYAGGVGEAELQRFWSLAGEYRSNVAQACTFAADARVRAGLVTDHTRLAASVFCQASPEAAAAVAARARVDLPPDGPVPAYEIWRQRIAHEFVSLGRS